MKVTKLIDTFFQKFEFSRIKCLKDKNNKLLKIIHTQDVMIEHIKEDNDNLIRDILSGEKNSECVYNLLCKDCKKNICDNCENSYYCDRTLSQNYKCFVKKENK